MSNSVLTLNYPLAIMKFKLIYDGPLPSGQNRGTVDIQQNIRRCIHAQIKSLLQTHPAFSKQKITDPGVDIMGRDWTMEELTGSSTMADFTYATLVDGSKWRTCNLDILVMRYKWPGEIINNRDLDNSIKTLLDGLCPPQNREQLSVSDHPKPDENPFYCLLSNDKYISGFSVRSDQLLTPRGVDDETYARVLIDVSVQVSRMLQDNLPFLVD